MDKWFALQIAHAEPAEAAELTARLTGREDCDRTNPTPVRSVIGALAANHAGFHHRSGEGYRLVADWLLRLDPLNPQTAARVSTAFETWPRYDATRRKRAKAWLKEKNIEFVERSLTNADDRKFFMENYPTMRSVPQIFITKDGVEEHIGGYQNLVEYNF